MIINGWNYSKITTCTIWNLILFRGGCGGAVSLYCDDTDV